MTGRRSLSRELLVDVVRLVPDIVRLLSRLARDRSLPAGLRFRLWCGAAYLALPLDLIPDFVPVLGQMDDALVIGLLVRSVLRRAGTEGLERHWPGTPDGLSVVLRVAGRGPQ